MEFTLNKTPLGTLCARPDTVSEQPVDMDFTLPDYCPDIEKILRCRINPKIYNRSLSGGQLTVDGAAAVSVLYTDSAGNLRACEQTSPFSAAIPVSDMPESCALDTYTKPEYVNCRALSRRRLSIHGAFSIYARVLRNCPLDIASPSENDSLEFDVREIEAASLSAFCSEQFTAGDGIKVTNKPPVSIIFDSSVRADISSTKLIPDRLMLNGELAVHLLYLSSPDSPNIETLDCAVPFSQVIDCRGLREDSEVCVNLNVLSSDVRVKNDILSETPVLSIDAKVNALVLAYSTKNVSVISDAYSTESAVIPDFANISIPCRTRVLSDTYVTKDTLEELELGEIVDITADVTPLTPTLGESEVTLNEKLTVRILGRDKDGGLVYIERSRELSKEIPTEERFENVDGNSASIVSLSYRMCDGNTVEIRPEIRYCLTLSDTKQLKAVTSVVSDDTAKLRRKPCSLILYYASQGERIWDIAKSFNIAVKSVTDENQIDEDILAAPRMLLIPTA